MDTISNADLIDSARRVIRPRRVGGRLFADVGCTLVTRDGHQFSGVSIDTASGTGFCAEHAAVAAMVTAGEYSIAKIVAVWQNDDELYVLPPCGRCREFLRQVAAENLETEVVLGNHHVVRLVELLPAHDWPKPLS